MAELALKDLGEKDPSQFKTRSVVAQYLPDKGAFNLSYVEPDLSFKEMSQLRTAVDRNTMRDELFGPGHKCANLGVGVILTLSLGDLDYLACQQQGRADVGDVVYNPIGGYVEKMYLANPQLSVDEEIAEEFLPVHGERNLIQIARGRRVITRPSDYFRSDRFIESSHVIPLLSEAKYTPKGLGKMLIDGKLPEGNPGILLEYERNSAKAVYSDHLNPEGFGLQELGVSLHHSEDKLDKGTGKLKVQFHPYGMLLIQLEGGKLTDEMFTLERGVLTPRDPKGIVLSEVFLADKESIAVKNKLPLEEFLKMQ